MMRVAFLALVAASALTGTAFSQETVPGIGQGASPHAGAVPDNSQTQPTARLSGSATGASGQPLEGEHKPGSAIGASGGSAGPNEPARPGSAMQNPQAPQ